jgi:hypothetical protein
LHCSGKEVFINKVYEDNYNYRKPIAIDKEIRAENQYE